MRGVVATGVSAMCLLCSAEVGAQRQLFSSARVPSGVWVPDRLPEGSFVDVDRDGAMDVLVMGSQPLGVGPVDGKFTMYLNDGSGRARAVRYGQWSEPAGTGRFGGYPAHGDLNGDGEIDVLVVGVIMSTAASVPKMLPFEGDGRGNFIYSTAVGFHPPLAARPFGFPAIRDLDGDGHMDVMVRVANGPPVLYINDGRGVFQEQSGAFPVGASSFWIRFADLDQDGDLDLVTDYGAVFTNDGGGMFRQAVVLPGGGAQALDVGDLTGDGYDDILFAPYAPAMQLYVNDGRGGFVDESLRFQVSWPANPVPRSEVQVIDLDGDGDLDVFAPGQPVEAYLNDGTGMFTDGRAALGLTQGYGSLMVDMDRDGDLDMWRFTPVLQESYWYPGLLTSVLANDPPLGGALNIELHAAPGRSVSYLLGFARLDAFIPGIGWSALDPSLTVPWPSAATVPAAGVVTTSLSVPNQVALRGLRFYLQGVEADLASRSIHAMNVWPVTIQ